VSPSETIVPSTSNALSYWASDQQRRLLTKFYANRWINRPIGLRRYFFSADGQFRTTVTEEGAASVFRLAMTLVRNFFPSAGTSYPRSGVPAGSRNMGFGIPE
jgi:hypothetical protein